MINEDLLIPVFASELHIGDKLYLGEERFGKLFTCKTVSPIVVSDSFSQSEYTLDPKEPVLIPDDIIQFIHEYLPDYENNPDYIELLHIISIINSSDYMEQFSAEVVDSMYTQSRLLYSKLFAQARKHCFK